MRETTRELRKVLRDIIHEDLNRKEQLKEVTFIVPHRAIKPFAEAMDSLKKYHGVTVIEKATYGIGRDAESSTSSSS